MYSEKNKKDVLEFLKGGYKLNALIAHREFGHIGSTLAGIVRELRLEGWDIMTKLKKAPKSGRKYAEYSLSPNWRLVSEELKRQEILESGQQSITIRNLKIGDEVVLLNGYKVTLTVLSLSELVGRMENKAVVVFKINQIAYKTNKNNLKEVEYVNVNE